MIIATILTYSSRIKHIEKNNQSKPKASDKRGLKPAEKDKK